MSKLSNIPHNDTPITTPQDQEIDASQTDTEMSQAPQPTPRPPEDEVRTPPKLATGGMLKRPRPMGLTKHSIHRPFKSPLKTSTANPPRSSGTYTLTTPRASQATEQLPPQDSSLPHSSQPEATPLQKPKARSQFRSPLPRNPDQKASLSSSSKVHHKTSVGRFLEIKDLESKINDLRSSIRNCTMVLRHQEKDDVPLEELTAKWKRVSHEGAQALLEKMEEQEQVFGEAQSYNDYCGSSSSSQGFGGYNSEHSQSWGEGMDPQARLDMIKQRMDYEDTEQDLPTVSEAIRSRMWPEISVPKPPTKMQRLLAGLGVDLDTIGYSPETDSFASKAEE
ncbi:MAG: hypothetical protein BYD32DRAFT_419693 [Podila humilis]|nr:MAG: hypothetical protein BYD32DRAFT_419693 [Podila humilis]